METAGIRLSVPEPIVTEISVKVHLNGFAGEVFVANQHADTMFLR